MDYINAHGTSTPLNDRDETAAIKTVFGEHAYNLADQLDQVDDRASARRGGRDRGGATALALRDGILPPTINYEHPDPECDLDYVPNTARKVDIHVALSNSMGFGGHNAVVTLKKYEGRGYPRSPSRSSSLIAASTKSFS